MTNLGISAQRSLCIRKSFKNSRYKIDDASFRQQETGIKVSEKIVLKQCGTTSS